MVTGFIWKVHQARLSSFPSRIGALHKALSKIKWKKTVAASVTKPVAKKRKIQIGNYGNSNCKNG